MAQAREQRAEMEDHGDKRKMVIEQMKGREVNITEIGKDGDVVTLTTAEHGGKAVRLKECANVSFVLPGDVALLKIFIDRCVNVKLKLVNKLITSSIEINHSENVEVHTEQALGTVQCDECVKGYIRILFQEPEHFGMCVHQNSPVLEVGIGGDKPLKIGLANNVQHYTRLGESGQLESEAMVRGEKEMPLNFTGTGKNRNMEPDGEPLLASEEDRLKAEAKREEGNSAFRANDFVQAAVYYSEAIALCGDLHLAYANRAQCWLKTGNLEKALDDAVKCTELAPDYAKGWFRKGMALHAMERFAQALPALVKAESLDPKNTQIPHAIKMAQQMARMKGPGPEP